MHNFNVQQLRAFYALMSIGNVTKTADYLCVTQPTVSRQLQLLEEAVGFRIFDRKSGGRLVPTLEGVRFYEEIEGTLKVIDNLPQIAHSIVHYQSHRLRIAATTPLLNSDILINSIARIRQKHAQSTIHLERCRRENIEAYVAQGNAEIGICALPVNNPMLETKKLVTARAVAVLAKDHPLSDKTALSVEDVPLDQMILPTAPPLINKLQVYTHAAGGEMPPLRVHLVLTGLRLAEAGLGVIVSDPLTATAFTTERTKIVPWIPDIFLDYGYVVAKERQENQILSDLLDYLGECSREWSAQTQAGSDHR